MLGNMLRLALQAIRRNVLRSALTVLGIVIGVAAVIALFVFLIVRAFAVGRQAASLERYYAALVAQGIGVWLAAQAFINMGVNMGLLPTKGLTLPFLSFSGTGIVMNCVSVAILLRIDFENRYLMRGGAL